MIDFSAHFLSEVVSIPPSMEHPYKYNYKCKYCNAMFHSPHAAEQHYKTVHVRRRHGVPPEYPVGSVVVWSTPGEEIVYGSLLSVSLDQKTQQYMLQVDWVTEDLALDPEEEPPPSIPEADVDVFDAKKIEEVWEIIDSATSGLFKYSSSVYVGRTPRKITLEIVLEPLERNAKKASKTNKPTQPKLPKRIISATPTMAPVPETKPRKERKKCPATATRKSK